MTEKRESKKATKTDRKNPDLPRAPGFEFVVGSTRPQSGNSEDATVDLDAPEFVNRIVVTDMAETEVLAVADSLEEVREIVSHADFRANLERKFGKGADFVILNGRRSSTEDRHEVKGVVKGQIQARDHVEIDDIPKNPTRQNKGDADKPKIRGRDIVFEISKLRNAEAVAKEVLEKRPDLVYVALDLDRLKLSPADATKWISDFNNHYMRHARQQKRDELPPSIAVFANEISHEGKQWLRSIGVEAVIFERSLMSNEDCQTPTQLRDKLLPQIREVDKLAAQTPPKSPTRKMSPEEFKALNSYPPGVTPEDIDRLMKEVNKPEQADRWRVRSPEPKSTHAEDAKARKPERGPRKLGN